MILINKIRQEIADNLENNLGKKLKDLPFDLYGENYYLNDEEQSYLYLKDNIKEMFNSFLNYKNDTSDDFYDTPNANSVLSLTVLYIAINIVEKDLESFSIINEENISEIKDLLEEKIYNIDENNYLNNSLKREVLNKIFDKIENINNFSELEKEFINYVSGKNQAKEFIRNYIDVFFENDLNNYENLKVTEIVDFMINKELKKIFDKELYLYKDMDFNVYKNEIKEIILDELKKSNLELEEKQEVNNTLNR